MKSKVRWGKAMENSGLYSKREFVPVLPIPGLHSLWKGTLRRKSTQTGSGERVWGSNVRAVICVIIELKCSFLAMGTSDLCFLEKQGSWFWSLSIQLSSARWWGLSFLPVAGALSVSFCPSDLWAALYFRIVVPLHILFHVFESILRGLPERSMAQKGKT